MSVLFDGFYASCLSTFHLLYIVALGMTVRKLDMVAPNFARGLSKCVTNVILPCFIFAQIIRNFQISEYQLLFYSMFGCCSLFFFGAIIGLIIAKLLGFKTARLRFLTAVFSTPHTTSIPVILIQLIGPLLDRLVPAPPGFPADSTHRGFFYIVLNSIYSNIWRWSGCYALLTPDDILDDVKPEEKGSLNEPLVEEKIQEVLPETPEIKNQESGLVEKKEEPPKPKEADMTCAELCKKFINTPLVVSLITIGITLFPSFQAKFNVKGSALNETLISVNVMVSKSYSFVVIFMLGLTFADTLWGKSKDINARNILSGMDLFWLSLVKLVLMPLLLVPFLVYVFHTFLRSDDVLLFIYLFMASTPSAINIIIICSYKNAFVGTVSMLMIIMYAASVVTMTLQVTIFVWLLARINPIPPAAPVTPAV